eukprot:6021823-Prymnesium_polylepis.1
MQIRNLPRPGSALTEQGLRCEHKAPRDANKPLSLRSMSSKWDAQTSARVRDAVCGEVRCSSPTLVCANLVPNIRHGCLTVVFVRVRGGGVEPGDHASRSRVVLDNPVSNDASNLRGSGAHCATMQNAIHSLCTAEPSAGNGIFAFNALVAAGVAVPVAAYRFVPFTTIDCHPSNPPGGTRELTTTTARDWRKPFIRPAKSSNAVIRYPVHWSILEKRATVEAAQVPRPNAGLAFGSEIEDAAGAEDALSRRCEHRMRGDSEETAA